MAKVNFEKFPIGTWGHFTVDITGLTEERIADMAACGMTLCHSPYCSTDMKEATLKALDLCEKYGIKLILRNNHTHWKIYLTEGPEAFRRSIRTEYEAFGRHPACAGIFLGDEPHADELEDCTKAYIIATEECPGLILHINQNPGYAEKCTKFCRESGCNLLSFDRYSQMNPEPQGTIDFLRDMREYVALAKSLDVSLLAVMLAVGHFRYRVPGEDDLRWQMGVALACGAKAIFWYNFECDPRDANYRGCPLTEFGDHTPSYQAMKTLHLRFNRDFAEIMNHSIHRDVDWIGTEYPGFHAFCPNNALSREFALLGAYSAHGTAGLVTYLEGEGPYAGKKYVMITNNTPDTSDLFFLTTLPGKKVYHVYQDVEFDFEQRHGDAYFSRDEDCIRCGYWLAPGQFELFRFE